LDIDKVAEVAETNEGSHGKQNSLPTSSGEGGDEVGGNQPDDRGGNREGLEGKGGLHGFYYRRVEDMSRGQLFTAPPVLFLSVILALVLERDGRLGNNPTISDSVKGVGVGLAHDEHILPHRPPLSSGSCYLGLEDADPPDAASRGTILLDPGAGATEAQGDTATMSVVRLGVDGVSWLDDHVVFLVDIFYRFQE